MMRRRPGTRLGSGMRTHATRHLCRNEEKHELYMRLTVLEIERNRRDAEKQSLLKRLVALDARLETVRSEQAKVQQALLAMDEPSVQPEQTPRRDVFPIKY